MTMINKHFLKSLATKLPMNSFFAQIAKFKQLQPPKNYSYKRFKYKTPLQRNF